MIQYLGGVEAEARGRPHGGRAVDVLVGRQRGCGQGRQHHHAQHLARAAKKNAKREGR